MRFSTVKNADSNGRLQRKVEMVGVFARRLRASIRSDSGKGLEVEDTRLRRKSLVTERAKVGS